MSSDLAPSTSYKTVSDQFSPQFRPESDFAGATSPAQFFQSLDISKNVQFPFTLEEVTTAFQKYKYSIDSSLSEDQRKGQRKAVENLTKLASNALVYVDTHTKGKEYIRTRVGHKPCLRPDCSFFNEKDKKALIGSKVVLLGDYKVEKNSESTFSDADLGQICSYLSGVMRIEQPYRFVIFGFLLNSEKIQFIRCRKLSDRLKFDITDCLPVRKDSAKEPIPEGLHCLYTLLAQSPDKLGYSPPVSTIPGVVAQTFLGAGASSYVFAHDESSVVKICHSESSAADEEIALQALKGIHHIPQILASNKNSLHIQPLAKELRPYHLFNTRHAHQGLNALEAAHKKGWVHRDIRPENFMLYHHAGQDDLLVNDWGFAVAIPQPLRPVPYKGTIIFASDRILEQLAHENYNIEPKPEDDLESYTRTLFCIYFPRENPAFDDEVQKHRAANRKIAQSKRVRKLWKERMPEYWCELQNFARKADYAGMRTVIDKLLPKRRDASLED